MKHASRCYATSYTLAAFGCTFISIDSGMVSTDRARPAPGFLRLKVDWSFTTTAVPVALCARVPRDSAVRLGESSLLPASPSLDSAGRPWRVDMNRRTAADFVFWRLILNVLRLLASCRWRRCSRGSVSMLIRASTISSSWILPRAAMETHKFNSDFLT